MRLLLDRGIARRAAARLRDRGFDAVHLSERGLVQLPDLGVLELAASEGRVVVTLDADFSALLALSGAGRPSVIHIRIEGLDWERASALIAQIASVVREDLEHGCIASVTHRGVRIRSLPVARPVLDAGEG